MLGRPAATRYPQPENRTSDDSTPHPPADRWIEVKPNTVQLVDEDCAFGRLLWLRMVLVVKAFGGPFQDFAFDHARVGAEPACGVDSAV
jgi:hypothetical protein